MHFNYTSKGIKDAIFSLITEKTERSTQDVNPTALADFAVQAEDQQVFRQV